VTPFTPLFWWVRACSWKLCRTEVLTNACRDFL
jgi:hypothetical protein